MFLKRVHLLNEVVTRDELCFKLLFDKIDWFKGLIRRDMRVSCDLSRVLAFDQANLLRYFSKLPFDLAHLGINRVFKPRDYVLNLDKDVVDSLFNVLVKLLLIRFERILSLCDGLLDQFLSHSIS